MFQHRVDTKLAKHAAHRTGRVDHDPTDILVPENPAPQFEELSAFKDGVSEMRLNR
jgi:hypothetical protein